MGNGERQQAEEKAKDRGQMISDCGLGIGDFKKTENRNSTVGAAFSRDFYDLNGFNDLTNERIF